MISAIDYHSDAISKEPSLSSSIARLLVMKSPLHAWMAHPRLNPHYVQEEDTKFDIGSAAHALLLEGADRMEVVAADDWRTKAAKETRDAARAAGKHPVLTYQYEAIKTMVKVAKDAIAQNEDLAGYTIDGPDGISEHTTHWHEGGTYFRARFDRISVDRRLILDYKTVGNAEPEDFLKHAINMGYDIQGAFYLMANERPDTKFIWIAQEIEPPYAVSFPAMSPALVELGMSKVKRAISIWRECMASNKWPGYNSRVLYMEPPAWALTREEEANGVFE